MFFLSAYNKLDVSHITQFVLSFHSIKVLLFKFKCTFPPFISSIHIFSPLRNIYLNSPLPPIAQKIKFSIEDFFSKCDQISSFLWIWTHLLKKPSMESFNFCAVTKVLFAYNCSLFVFFFIVFFFSATMDAPIYKKLFISVIELVMT